MWAKGIAERVHTCAIKATSRMRSHWCAHTAAHHMSCHTFAQYACTNGTNTHMLLHALGRARMNTARAAQP